MRSLHHQPSPSVSLHHLSLHPQPASSPSCHYIPRIPDLFTLTLPTLQSSPIHSNPIHSSPIHSNPIHSIPFRTTTNPPSPLQILLGLLTIAPWTLLVAYDLLLYLFRTALFYTPLVGGRATGQRERPRAPSLHERPHGEARTLLFGLRGGTGPAGQGGGDIAAAREPGPRKGDEVRGRATGREGGTATE